MPVDDLKEGGGSADGLRFFGAITASTTHELRNVVATIEQITGLLEDHIAGLQTGQTPSLERLENVRERIAKQTRRAGAVIDRLNLFAHTVDEPYCNFDLCDLLRNLLGVCERLAMLWKARIAADFPNEKLLMQARPFEIQRAVFACLEDLWTQAEPGTELKLTISKCGGGATVVIEGPAQQPSAGGDYVPEGIRQIVARAGGGIASELRGGKRRFELKFAAEA
jgi:hypothetical protein